MTDFLRRNRGIAYLIFSSDLGVEHTEKIMNQIEAKTFLLTPTMCFQVCIVEKKEILYQSSACFEASVISIIIEGYRSSHGSSCDLVYTIRVTNLLFIPI